MTRPLTAKEQAIADLVARGLHVHEVRTELEAQGIHMALSTLQTRIRGIARKLDNPHDLTPLALIRLHIRTSRAA